MFSSWSIMKQFDSGVNYSSLNMSIKFSAGFLCYRSRATPYTEAEIKVSIETTLLMQLSSLSPYSLI